MSQDPDILPPHLDRRMDQIVADVARQHIEAAREGLLSRPLTMPTALTIHRLEQALQALTGCEAAA